MSITLRYRSKFGTSRANFRDNDDLSVVHQHIANSMPQAQSDTIKISDKPSGPFQLITALYGRSIGELGMKHGDMLFLQFDELDQPASQSIPTIVPSLNKVSGDVIAKSTPEKASQPVKDTKQWKVVHQDPLDDALEKLDGKIPRPRDNKMCKHGMKGMCDYCMPLEPYDASYMESHKIKHCSFHAYLRKINSATNKPELNASFIPPLSEPDVRVNPHCTTGHAPWPGGICSKCQPSAITLQRQEFRLLDHLEFATPQIIDQFLDFWRNSGSQRFGILYGAYEAYDAVPLGQKGVVEAIYEPPQVCQADGIELLPWENEQEIDKIAAQCGLQKVGLIFTDLTDDGSGTGAVLPKRHIDSFFLSSLEAGLSASYQTLNPNKTRWCATGQFGSKFATAVITGSIDRQIEISPYQISEQGVAMFEASIIEPSIDPNTILVCPEGSGAYIPEVFYSKINEYGRQVKENAKPAFPMEYLLVTLTHGFPKEPNPKFCSNTFPVENRAAIGQAGDFQAVAKHLHIGGETTLTAISDFHLLLYIISVDILSPQDVSLLLEVATTRDGGAAEKLVSSDGWKTLLAILSESSGMPSTSGSKKRSYADNGRLTADSITLQSADMVQETKAMKNASAQHDDPIQSSIASHSAIWSMRILLPQAMPPRY